MTGKSHGLVIDTPDPRGLATFYQELLGFVRVQDDDHWVVIGDAADRPGLAFQLAPKLASATPPESKRIFRESAASADGLHRSDQDSPAPSRSSANQGARHGQDHLRRPDRGSVQGGP